MNNNVYDFIKSEETAFKTVRVPLTDSKDWNMSEHIERCYNVANAYYHSGKNDGLRRYDDIVTPIINVAFRTEGFDVKDIVPFVNDAVKNYKSFIIKKRHPQWARKNEIDTFIDDIVESSVIYDLVVVKKAKGNKPEVVPLQSIAFCDQTDIQSGALCLKHQYTVSQMMDFKDKWDADAIDYVVTMARAEKSSSMTNTGKPVQTPGKYIEVYELHGMLPEDWLKEGGNPDKYVAQLHIVAFYTGKDGERNGVSLFSGKEKSIFEGKDAVFKTLKVDRIRSQGRACGKSIVESLFEPQVWMNYSAQRIQKLLASAINVFYTDSEEFGNQKLSTLPENTILKIESGKQLGKVDGTLQNLNAFTNDQANLTSQARIVGSASEAQLGTNPTAGTPFALQNLVVQQGQGIHEYRQGKIATFVADVLYRDWILNDLVADLNSGEKFSEILTLDEMQEIVDQIATNKAEAQIKEAVLNGKLVTESDRKTLLETYKEQFMKDGSRKFFEIIEGELEEVPMDVYVNVKGKQRYMAQNADKITNIIRQIISAPQAFAQIPGIGKAFNQLLEESGMSAIDFSQTTKALPAQPSQVAPPMQAESVTTQ